jgi:hypothetical protein
MRRLLSLAAVMWLAQGAASIAQSSSKTYPVLYRAQKLPELASATIISTGRQTTSLRDGLRIDLTTLRPLSDVREFYRRALTAAGWKERESTPASRAAEANPRGAMLTFSKDRLTYTVTIVVPPDAETRVMINLVER